MMTSEVDEVNRLYRIRKTLMEMLNDRDYMVTDSEINMSKDEFIAKYGSENIKKEELTFQKAKRNDSKDQFQSINKSHPYAAQWGVSHIRTGIKRMESDKVYRGVLVVQQKLTSYSKQTIDQCSSTFHLEVFLEAELLVNISRHVLVPEHKLLTDDEKKSLLDRYTVKETKLPRIQVSDPIARYYGLKRGQVVRINRPSETAGKYITYRFVV